MFLEGFWRADIKYQAFIAMPFGSPFDDRFAKIYKPAIETIEVVMPQRAPTENTYRLSAYRVDNSKSGDSILTEIMDGIAHSLLVLADLSEVGRWINSANEIYATPNGNVMYEVGLALACRQQPEVILVRDKKDRSKLLFDVSTIPCVPIDFEDMVTATTQLKSLLMDRLKEIDWRKSNKVAMTLASLTPSEIQVIRQNKANDFLGWKNDIVNFVVDNALPGLLDKGIIRYHGIHVDEQVPVYTWTTFGNVIRNRLPVIERPAQPNQDAQ